LLVSVISQFYMQASKEREERSSSDDMPHFQDELNEQQEQQDEQAPHRRLMVCAPTNKAISVLASRFLTAMNREHCNCNVLMVGDADKLLVDERSSGGGPYRGTGGGGGSNSQLREVFLYQWMQVVCEDYRKIRDSFLPGGHGLGGSTPEMLFSLADRLEKRLMRCLPGLPASTIALTTKVSMCLFKMVKGNSAAAMHYDLVPTIERLLQALLSIPQDVLTRQLLLSSDVIFCTLASSGGVVFKNYMNRVDSLIVDEAAAATEPEICIPICGLQPSRVLVVGDPQQVSDILCCRASFEQK